MKEAEATFSQKKADFENLAEELQANLLQTVQVNEDDDNGQDHNSQDHQSNGEELNDSKDDKSNAKDEPEQQEEASNKELHVGYVKKNDGGIAVSKRTASSDSEHLEILKSMEWMKEKVFPSREAAEKWLNEPIHRSTPWSRSNQARMPTPPMSNSRQDRYGREYQDDWQDEIEYQDDWPDELLRAQFEREPEGYFEDGQPYIIDDKGNRIPVNYPRRMDLAGLRVPTEETCRIMQEEFHREDYGMDYFDKIREST